MRVRAAGGRAAAWRVSRVAEYAVAVIEARSRLIARIRLLAGHLRDANPHLIGEIEGPDVLDSARAITAFSGFAVQPGILLARPIPGRALGPVRRPACRVGW